MSSHGHHCHHDHMACNHGRGDARRLTIALAIIGGFAVIEVVGGIISGSLALLADAGHMVTDGMAIALALVAKHLATRAPTRAFPFGQHRAQVLAAFVNGLALMVLIAFLLMESFSRFSSPRPIDVGVMMSVAALGLGANILAFFVLHGGNTDDVNMRGAVLHVVGDILGSVAAIVSAVIIGLTGFLAADPIVTLLVCALIGRSAWRLIRETGVVLLQGTPESLETADIERRIVAIPHVVNVHDLRVWMLTPQKPQATMHVQVDDPLFADETLRAVKDILRSDFDIADSTIQMETYTVMARSAEKDALRISCPDTSSVRKEPMTVRERSQLH